MQIMKSRQGEGLAGFAARAHRYADGTAIALYFAPQGALQATATAMREAFPAAVSLGLASVRLFDGDRVECRETLLFLFEKDDADIRADAMLIEKISKAPIAYVLDVQRRVRALGKAAGDTVCLEFCTNDEEMLVTSLTAMLAPLGVPLFGGTAFHTDILVKRPSEVHFQVAWQGRLYEDACIALFLKNLRGRVRLYREIFYEVREGSPMHLATKVDAVNRRLVELDDRPAANVYSEETGIRRTKILSHVLDRPIGRMLGDEVFVISMRGVEKDGAVATAKAVNLNDAIYILDLADYRSILRDTCEAICEEIPERQFVFAIECYHRYMFYETHGVTEKAVQARAGRLGACYGIVSGGEQIRGQNANQTGLYLVFEGKGGGAHEVE